jgi:hypothetical protein
MPMRALGRSIAQHMAEFLIGTWTPAQVTFGRHMPEDMWRAFHACGCLNLPTDRIGEAVFPPCAAAVVAWEERAIVSMGY